MKDTNQSLTTKQTWVLSTIALAGGLTKHHIQQLWGNTMFPGRPYPIKLSYHDTFNMRTTLESLVRRGLIKKSPGKKNITLYYITSHLPGLWPPAQPYKPFTTKVMTYLNEKYLGGS